jgi:hypothetical protein
MGSKKEQFLAPETLDLQKAGFSRSQQTAVFVPPFSFTASLSGKKSQEREFEDISLSSSCKPRLAKSENLPRRLTLVPTAQIRHCEDNNGRCLIYRHTRCFFDNPDLGVHHVLTLGLSTIHCRILRDQHVYPAAPAERLTSKANDVPYRNSASSRHRHTHHNSGALVSGLGHPDSAFLTGAAEFHASSRQWPGDLADRRKTCLHRPHSAF